MLPTRHRSLRRHGSAWTGTGGAPTSMDAKPQAMLVMDPESFRAHYDSERLDRLRSLVTLGEPMWTDALDSAAARARLADTEVLLTSWGAPELTAERLRDAGRLRAVFHG